MKCYVLDGTDSITIAKIYDIKQRYIFFYSLKIQSLFMRSKDMKI